MENDKEKDSGVISVSKLFLIMIAVTLLLGTFVGLLL